MRYCVITAMRNCGPLIPAFRRMVDAFDFQPSRIVIGVNDCTDDTERLLREWNHPALDIFSFSVGVPTFAREASGERALHLANVRNRVIDYAMTHPDWDFALMQDAAKMSPPELPRRLLADGGDIVAAFSVCSFRPSWFYDTWCFRDLAGAPFSHFPQLTQARVELQAVGGVYVVSRRVLESGCRLAGTDGRDCDSVPLCQQARSLGYRVFLRNDVHVTAYRYPDEVPRLPPINGIFLAGDYVSPGLLWITPDQAFPHMIPGPAACGSFPHMSPSPLHNVYVDERSPTVPFLTRDEAQIVYNTALRFRDAPGLQVGGWLGWSACHAAAGGVRLTVIDPLYAQAPIQEIVSQSLKAACPNARIELLSGEVTATLDALANAERWRFLFFDGDPTGSAPLEAARRASAHAADDALFLYSHAAAPSVAAALDYLRAQGWQTMVYLTTHGMAVAWRGTARPLPHRPDPRVEWQVPAHLTGFQICRPSSPSLA